MKNFHFSFLFIFSITLSFAQNTASFEELNLPLDTFLNNADTVGGYQSGDAFFPNVFNPDFGGFWESGWAISTMRDDTTSGFGNLYGAITGGGQSSTTYAVGQQNAIIRLEGNSVGKVVDGLYVTNTTFAHNSMQKGDMFAKKFGGIDGTDPDFFKLEIRKFDQGILDTNTIEFYLADFRSETDSLDYIVNDWQWVDLSNLGNVDSLQFTMSSSDLGDNGINTPLFFAIDNLEISEEVSTSNENITLTNEAIKFYPNPVINEIIMDFEETEMVGKVQVFDLLGRPLIQQPFGPNQNRIDVSRLTFGTYILQVVSSEDKYFSSTFVKQ